MHPPQPTTGPAPSIFQVWRFAWRRGLRRELPLCLKWFAASALSFAPALLIPVLLGDLMNRVKNAGMPGATQNPWVTFAFWAALLLVLGPAATLIEKLQSVRLDMAIGRHLKRDAYAAVLAKPLRYFHEQDRGALLFTLREMCSECMTAIRQLTLEGLLLVFQLLASVILVLWMFIQIATDSGKWTNAGIALFLMLMGLAAPLLVGRFAKRFQSVSEGLREANQASMSLLEGSLRSPEELKAFDAVDRNISKYDASLAMINERRAGQSRAVSMANVLNSLPTDFVQVVLLAAALFLALKAGSSPGSLVSILLLAPQLMRPLQGLSSFAMTYHTSLPSLTKLMELLQDDVPPPGHRNDPVAKPAPPRRNAAAVEATDVIFQYEGTTAPILSNFNLHIVPGSIAALVAQKGTGKSTFFRLLLDFYQPQAGLISVDGRPVQDWPKNDLRLQIAYMAQFPSFTHESVRENFYLAAPEATDAEMLEIIRNLGLEQVLESKFGPAPGYLDQGFASGQLLSGGERKLFALARCLLRRPSLLLLDEPTTGLDNKSKTPLATVIRQLAPSITILIIDHDVAWLHKLCNHVAVLEQGQIRFQGTPGDAEKMNDLYRELLGSAADAPGNPLGQQEPMRGSPKQIWAEVPPSPDAPPKKTGLVQ